MCKSHLRAIGKAILQYTQDNAGHYPDSLGTILLMESVSSSVFRCPSSNDWVSVKPTAREQAAEIDSGKCCSYIYPGRGLLVGDVAADQVIVFEPLSNHNGDGMNVLFGDGLVEFVFKAQGASILNQVSAGKTVVRCPEGK